ncbi:MAG: hypothetical protein VYD99_06215, partial [Planctomycetota bacterium]|nr:hypothetical protein [Planctomycetota bacterium]
MLLTVFDIDGTLCRTSGIDDSCWIRTARELFGVEKLSTDWSDYPHSTDESIAATLLGDVLASLKRKRPRIAKAKARTIWVSLSKGGSLTAGRTERSR